MRIAYADPPYPGCAHLYKDHPDYAGEVDHADLIDRLERDYDGWVVTSDHDHPWGEIDHHCAVCSGSGRVYWNDSPYSDPACVEDAECPACRGSGVENEARAVAA